MKLYTVAEPRRHFLAAEYKGSLVDLGAIHEAFLASGKVDEAIMPQFPKTMLGLTRCGQAGLRTVERLLYFISKRPPLPMGLQIYYPMDEVQFVAPLPRPGKIILSEQRDRGEEIAQWNFHAKFPSTVVGPEQAVRLPQVKEGTGGFRVSLALIVGEVIGNTGESQGARWSDSIFGYTYLLDLHSPVADEGFSLLNNNFPNSCPMAPCIFAAGEKMEEAGEIIVAVNGETAQRFISSIPPEKITGILNYLSTRIAFEPGDIVALPLNFRPPSETEFIPLNRSDEVKVQLRENLSWGIKMI